MGNIRVSLAGLREQKTAPQGDGQEILFALGGLSDVIVLNLGPSSMEKCEYWKGCG